MKFIDEFKQFAIKGNVVDMAVGIIIGGAFGKIVTSLVEDIITPAILTPALKAANLQNLSELVVPGTAIKSGNFLSAALSFLIVAFALFIMIKGINRLKRKEEPKPTAPAGPTQVQLLAEIRDLLRKQQ